MSATNRNGLERHPDDFYETPVEAIDAALDALGLDATFAGYIVDAGSGTGAIASRIAIRCPLADVRGVELTPELVAKAQARAPNVAWEIADWLEWQPDGAPDLVLGNPPYQKMHWDPDVIIESGKRKGEKGKWMVDDKHLAEKFIRKALHVVGKRGRVGMLLRANYMVPAVRRALRKEFGLPARHELEQRPSFNGSGTDATDYAWHEWGGKRAGRWDVVTATSADGSAPVVTSG